MTHFRSIIYQMKRVILSFSNKISRHLSRPDKKFSADMTYGILASKSCHLTDISNQLHENSKRANTVERLTRHLDKGAPPAALQSYLSMIRSMASSDPVIFINDSDIVKPDGKRFESLELVRDVSKSSYSKNVYEKGYHVTEACVLTKSGHPVSIFSQVHSSKEQDFISVNDITFRAHGYRPLPFWKIHFCHGPGL